MNPAPLGRDDKGGERANVFRFAEARDVEFLAVVFDRGFRIHGHPILDDADPVLHAVGLHGARIDHVDLHSVVLANVGQSFRERDAGSADR